MNRLSLPDRENGRPLRILCLGAHSDDIEIGCGGAILRLRESEAVEIQWVVFSATGERGEEAKTSAEKFAGISNLRAIDLKAFRDGFLPYDGARVKDTFEELKVAFSPDLIFTHTSKDAHQDHRLVCELTWNTFRDHLILEYEIPKYDGDLGQPNVFVPLSAEISRRKVDYLMDVFATQRQKRWFRAETFEAMMRLRGMECNAAEGLAEAFYCRKMTL